MKFSTSAICAAVAVVAGAISAPRARADDIDIFLTNASGTSTAANVMFMLDNTSDFGANNQKILDTNGNPESQTGQAEVDAITRVTAALQAQGLHINIGAALGTNNAPNVSDCSSPGGITGENKCTSGAYVLYGARDLSVAANFKAFASILGYGPTNPASGLLPAPCTGTAASSIWCDITGSATKIPPAAKDDSAWMYELYLYFMANTGSFNQIPAWAGDVALVASNNSPVGFADYQANNSGLGTTKGQGLTGGWALNSGGHKYVGAPDTGGCGNNYIVYIVNAPASLNKMSPGESKILGTPSGVPVDTGSLINVPSGFRYWLPNWTKFLHDHGITTYIVDVYKANPPPDQFTNVLSEAARQGGTTLLNVSNETALVDTLSKIFAQITATSAAFAATALPASATNRSVDQDQVYLGVFRPDKHAIPQWFGNLKRYQILLDPNNVPFLADAIGADAINPLKSGFIDICAASYWDKDTSAYKPAAAYPTAKPYWTADVIDPDPKSECPGPADGGWGSNPANPANTKSSAQFQPPSGVTWDPHSDSPDGPSVEKGGVAEVLRRGNIAATATDTWQNNNRTVLTGTSSPLGAFSSSSTTLNGLGVDTTTSTLTLGKVVDFVLGWDSKDENGNGYINPNAPVTSTTNETRPSIHGDVIHSTPLPITYSPSSVVIYYGSNDGMYHAVDASTGVEKWAYLASEFYGRMNRQYTGIPLIAYPGFAAGTPTPTPKDYFFDGSTGLYQSSETPPLTDWIYPTMRRGGRMIYAFDVSPVSGSAPAKPTFLWKAGCDDAAGTCTVAGIDGIGQTWSKPQIGVIQNGPTDSSPKPLLVVGGGYDSTHTTTTVNGVTTVKYAPCEDTPTNSKTTSCTSTRKGKVIYVMDAHNGPGTLFAAIPLPGSNPGSVVGDVSLLDFDGDGYIDYAYLSDTTGNVYRADFVDRTGGSLTVLTKAQWPSHIYRIGHTNVNGEGRKFMFGPTLLVNQGSASKALVYVGLGSGDREHPLASEYPYTTPVQNRFYLFLDDPTSNSTDLNLDGSLMENADPTANTSAGAIDCASAGTTGHTGVTPNTFPNPSGWYMDLANDRLDTISNPLPTNHYGNGGEQTVTPAVIIAGQVTWGTNIANPNTSNSCSNGLGDAYGYLVDLTNGSGAIGVSGTCGGSTSTPYTGGGLPLPPTVGTVGVVDPTTGDTTYVPICIGCPPKGGGASGGAQPHNDVPLTGEKRTRVYWFTPNFE